MGKGPGAQEAEGPARVKDERSESPCCQDVEVDLDATGVYMRVAFRSSSHSSVVCYPFNMAGHWGEVRVIKKERKKNGQTQLRV